MAKHFRKITAAMLARSASHNGMGPNQQNKHRGTKPGSQNRKKAGYVKSPKP